MATWLLVIVAAVLLALGGVGLVFSARNRSSSWKVSALPVAPFFRDWALAFLLLHALLIIAMSALGGSLASLPPRLQHVFVAWLGFLALLAALGQAARRRSIPDSPTTTRCGSAPDSEGPASQVRAVAAHAHNADYARRLGELVLLRPGESPGAVTAAWLRAESRRTASRWPASLRRSAGALEGSAVVLPPSQYAESPWVAGARRAQPGLVRSLAQPSPFDLDRLEIVEP